MAWRKQKMTMKQAVAAAQADADRTRITQVVYLYRGSYFTMAETSARANRITPVKVLYPAAIANESSEAFR